MSQSPVTVVRQYATKLEAEMVRARLASAGIQAFVTGEDMRTALGLGGAATSRLVHLEVAEVDFERADAILREDDRQRAEAGPWVCSRCREQNEATFEVCWSCNKPRTDDDQRGRIGQEQRHSNPYDEFESSRPIDREDGNPYRPVLISSRRVDVWDDAPEGEDEAASKCFRAAIVGMLVFPPLVSLYGIYLLLNLDSSAFRRNGQVRIAWLINLINIPAWTLFWLGFW